MELTIFQVDAFAEHMFGGNPAAICVIEDWLPEPIMQAIAMEINISETAFVVSKGADFRIRWFTPTTEVKLCGHATLAAAHILAEQFGYREECLRFHSLSGLLTARKSGDLIELDFPANPVIPVSMPEDLDLILGGSPKETWANEDLIVLYDDPAEISILEPNFTALSKLPYRGVCATAPDHFGEYDFVCRFFCPAAGINEDPVTGSLYTELAPFYETLLGKSEFIAQQVSKRSGVVKARIKGNRVLISGKAITTMTSLMSFTL